jgi:hypothetical protein
MRMTASRSSHWRLRHTHANFGPFMSAFPIRRILRLAGLLVFAAALALWAATGAHRGWTRTQATEMQRDEVTGIEYPVTHDRFVAGVEVPALGAGAAAVLLGASLLVGRPSRKRGIAA